MLSKSYSFYHIALLSCAGAGGGGVLAAGLAASTERVWRLLRDQNVKRIEQEAEAGHSLTASAAVLMRYLSSKHSSAVLQTEDPLAAHFVYAEHRLLDPMLMLRAYEEHFPGVFGHVAARTKVFDGIFRERVAEVEQVVLLGSGFDTRPYRMSELGEDSGVKVFEVDTVPTLMEKCRVLFEAGVGFDHVEFVPVDFEVDSLENELLAHGFKTDVKTLYLWEFVTAYLTEEAVVGTLEMIRRLSGAGCLLGLDYVAAEIFGAAHSEYQGAEEFLMSTAAMNEDAHWGVAEGKHEQLFGKHGYEVEAHWSPAELNEGFLSDSEGNVLSKSYSFYHIALLSFEGASKQAQLDLQQEILFDLWNATGDAYNANSAVHIQFLQSVSRYPDSCALCFGNAVLTYSDLLRQCFLISAQLQQMHAVVALCAAKCLEEVVGLVSILLCGSAYVPLDPKLPGLRLTYVLDSCSIRQVVVQQLHAEKVNSLSHPFGVIVIPKCTASSSLPSPQLQFATQCLSLNAYILFTSGSTGQPKGLMVEHNSLAAYVAHSNLVLSLGVYDSTLFATPITFDASVELVWCTLTAGAKLIIAKPNATIDPNYLALLVHQEQVTYMNLVPSVASLVLELADAFLPPSLNTFFLLGEVCKPNLVSEILKQHPRVQLHNRYGPAEVTIASHGFQCRSSEHPTCIFEKSVPIGKALPNVQCFLSAEQQIDTLASVGELCLGGPQVSLGYLGPNLTANAFVHQRGSGRVYRTGDRVQRLQDGYFDFLGRVDFQVRWSTMQNCCLKAPNVRSS